MLNAHDITVSFSGEELFSGITFKLNAGDRIGLVGKNGAGKSTLLKIVSGEQEYDRGSMAFDKDISLGFLKQDIDFEEGRTVLEEAYQAFKEIKSIEEKLETVNTQLAERTDYESEYYHNLMHDLDELSHRYELIGGYNYQGETEKILSGLGFKQENLHQMTDTFSGGWRMRIAIAKVIFSEPEILMLDEPTNHLDLVALIWLEKYIQNLDITVLIVSHARDFLNQVVDEIIEFQG